MISLFSWQCQNHCLMSLAFIIDWRVVHKLCTLCSIPQAISINFFSSDSKRISDVIMKVFDAATTERYLKYVEAHTTILQVPSIIQHFL